MKTKWDNETGRYIVIVPGDDVTTAEIFTFAFIHDCASSYGDNKGNKTCNIQLPGMDKPEFLNAVQIQEILDQA